MAEKSSGRKGGGGIRSDPGLLTPLPTAGQPEASTAADVRALAETIEEPEAPVTRSPRPDDSEASAFQQAAQEVSTAIKALRTDPVQAEERRAGRIPDIRGTQTAIPKGIGGLAVTVRAVEAIRGALEARVGELRDSREAAELLTRSDDAVAGGAARPGNALDRADASGHARADPDACRDDVIRDVNGLPATVEREAAVPASETTALESTARARVDRVTARLSPVGSEVGTATMAEAFGAVTASPAEHGGPMRGAGASSLRIRKEAGFRHAAFDGREREYRRLRPLRVALPAIPVVNLAGMPLVNDVAPICRSFR